MGNLKAILKVIRLTITKIEDKDSILLSSEIQKAKEAKWELWVRCRLPRR